MLGLERLVWIDPANRTGARQRLPRMLASL
jgi:hypothetical protein